MPTKDLLQLIESRQLPVGTKLHHQGRGYRDRTVSAEIVRGGIEYGGRVYTTPSAAAKSITGKPVDGWAFWRLPDGQRLDALRPGERRLV